MQLEVMLQTDPGSRIQLEYSILARKKQFQTVMAADSGLEEIAFWTLGRECRGRMLRPFHFQYLITYSHLGYK
jgi:hypothetical protein